MNFLVIDFGTSSCRASTVSEFGEILSTSQVPVTIERPSPTFAEVAVEHIWLQVTTAIKQELEKNPKPAYAAVGVSAMLGYVFLDKQSLPLMPAVIWMDNRASAEIKELLLDFSEQEIYRKTGRKISPELLAPKYKWLQQNRPEVAEKVEKIIGLKDEIIRRLTGIVGTDVVHLNYTMLYNIYQKRLDTELLKGLGIRETLFPADRTATEIAGRISDEGAKQTGLTQGTPVICGSSDGFAAMYGGGVMEKEKAVLVSGTTDVLMIKAASPVEDPDFSLICNSGAEPDSFLIGGIMGLSGGTMQKFEELQNRKLTSYEEAISTMNPGSAGLLLLPGLTGERAPYWKETLKGSLFGLTLEHRPEHIFRAIMEGTSFRIQKLLEVMQIQNLVPQELVVVGGCARLDCWNQIRADITNLPVSKPKTTEATTTGIALFCSAAIKQKSILAVYQEFKRNEKRYYPDQKRSHYYSQLGKVFHKTLKSTSEIYREMRFPEFHF